MEICYSRMILVILLLLGISSANSQQGYMEADHEGYSCVTNTTECEAYASYRALRGDTLRSVGLHFGWSADQIAEASQISSDATLETGQLLLVPLNCSCASGRSQYNVSYIIQSQDTFYIVSNSTFQGLTTAQAVIRANPRANPNTLQPGNQIIFPIRCACPTSSQRAAGVKSLVTYIIWPNQTLEDIARSWNLSQTDIAAENTWSGRAVQNQDLQAFTSLLLPITRDPPQLPQEQTLVPPPAAPPSTPGGGPSSSSSKGGIYGGIAAGCVAAVVLVAAIVFFYKRKDRKKIRSTSFEGKHGPSRRTERHKKSIIKENQTTGLTSNFTNNNKVHAMSAAPCSVSVKERQSRHDSFLTGLVDTDKPMLYAYQELCDATNNFSVAHLVQGSVYRGVLRNQLVAIKEMRGGTTSQEIKILCKTHHSNLVRLIGLCSGADSLFLVYEYAENGSLSSCLHTRISRKSELEDLPVGSSAFLSWNTRLQIALDVATGLEYIHDYVKPGCVHKDLKSSNVLLDGDLRAKIANFGMARLVNHTDLTKHIAGTQGYMSPEYLTHGFITTKVDVYAFGVVLLELFTGREAILCAGAGKRKEYLAEAFITLAQEFGDDGDGKMIEELKVWLDPVLKDAVLWDIASAFVALATSCVGADPDARPNMKDATYMLSALLESSLEPR